MGSDLQKDITVDGQNYRIFKHLGTDGIKLRRRVTRLMGPFMEASSDIQTKIRDRLSDDEKAAILADSTGETSSQLFEKHTTAEDSKALSKAYAAMMEEVDPDEEAALTTELLKHTFVVSEVGEGNEALQPLTGKSFDLHFQKYPERIRPLTQEVISFNRFLDLKATLI